MKKQGSSLQFRNLLVTGGCGFIGSNFIRFVLEQTTFKGRIINLDLLTYAGNPLNLSGLEEVFTGRYVFIKGDIADRKLLTRIFSDYKIDSVCHFAAESHVDRSIDAPSDFVRTNIIGTFQLLEAALSQEKFVRFHHVSTDEVFGSLGPQGYFTEKSPYKPNSPYSASKAASDHLVRAYNRTYNLPVTISNCSNNYGPYQFPEKLIPLIIMNGLEYKPLPVYGDGKHVRDWLYVTDHCQAIWQIMCHSDDGQTYNVGGNEERQNIEIVQKLCDILDEVLGKTKNGDRRELIRFVKDRPGHDRRYAIDSAKIKSDLEWAPTENLDSGLSKTVQWYINNQKWIESVKTGEYRKWIEHHYGEMK